MQFIRVKVDIKYPLLLKEQFSIATNIVHLIQAYMIRQFTHRYTLFNCSQARILG